MPKRLFTTKRSPTEADELIGQRMRAKRLELHISQDALAKRLGLSFQQVQKYEKGTNRIGVARLKEIADVLQTDIAYFVGDITVGKAPKPTKLSQFMATKDGINIVETMMKLTPNNRRVVLSLARSLDK